MPSSPKREALVRGLAIAHLVAALGIVLFWIDFYTGVMQRDVLAQKLPHVDAYLAFEEAFTVPDLLTAALAIFAAVRLLRDPSNEIARNIIVGTSGALVFLSLLDVSYDLRNGVYDLGIASLELAGAFLGVPLLALLGVATIALLTRHAPCSGLKAS